MAGLDKAILEAKKVENVVGHALSGMPVSDILKERIIAGFVSIAMYHHRSIIMLIEHQLHSSAFALTRPLVEACYRGNWISLVADDEICEKINSSTSNFKPTWELAQNIDDIIGGNTFYKTFKSNKDILNGMTHGGMELLGKQFDVEGELITSAFEDKELIGLLQICNAQLAMTLIGYSSYIKNDELGALAKKLLTNED